MISNELYHYNKNHDKLGRFASSPGGNHEKRRKAMKNAGYTTDEIGKALGVARSPEKHSGRYPSLFEEAGGGNREELEKAKNKINKKRLFENNQKYLDRRIRQEREAYDRYVDTSGIKDQSEKKKTEQRLFKEADINSQRNPISKADYKKVHHRSSVDIALDKKISNGETFMKHWSKLIRDVPEKTDAAGFNKRIEEYRGRKNHSNRVLNTILTESGYEKTKEGRKYIERLFASGYEMALEDSVR